MGSTNNHRKWRNFLIRAPIQLRITTYNLLFLYLVAGWVMVTILVPIYDGIQNPSDLLTQHYSAKFFLMLMERLAWLMGAVFIIGLAYQTIITHRFCGPMVNFSHTWQSVRQGDLTRRVHLRRRDFFKEEAAEINAMVENLDERLAAVAMTHRRTQELIHELDSAAARGQTPTPEALAEIKTAAKATQDELQQFTLSQKPPRGHVNTWSDGP